MTLGLGPGDALGAYRVVRVLGRGGMGVVLEAHDTGLRRQVALKVIAPHLAEDPAFRARFAREARALAALDSAHVVHVYAYGEEAGRLYLATQLVPDGDLGALLRESGPMPLPAAVDLVAQVADGLADAHAAGLVHRDIKPANVLLRRRDGQVRAYLSDFGIVHRVGADHTRATGTGTVGTPAYLAPELHTGEVAGVASDVYSLGCLLWAALTARPPYAGATDVEVATAHRDQPVPQLRGAGPMVRAVNRVLRDALAKDPARRCPSAASLRDDLRAAAALPAPAGPVLPDRRAKGVRRRHRPRAVQLGGVTAMLVLFGVGAGGVLLGDRDAAPSSGDIPARSSDGPTRAPPGTSATTSPDVERATASLADALEGQGAVPPAQAECAAARWIAGTGLQRMADLGFFDDGWSYIDQDRTAMTPRMDEAATHAVLRCAATR